ncbi:MAG: hypothetical protein PHW65_06365, partial [Dehalococcoidales bacterium]|nr:hypothetical protein [Dehalococcoidales bacterium]
MPRIYAVNEELNRTWSAVAFLKGVGVLPYGADTSFFSGKGYGIDTNKNERGFFDGLTPAQLEEIALYLGVTVGEEDTKQEIVRACETAISTIALDTVIVASGAGSLTPGILTVNVASILLDGGSKDIEVELDGSESTVALVAAAVRAALEADDDIATNFAVGGTGADIVLAPLIPAETDATLAITLSDDGGTGITFGSSEDTGAGTAFAKQIETIEVTHGADAAGTLKFRVNSSLLDGNTKTVDVPVTAEDDTAAKVAAAISAALEIDEDITEHYDIDVTDAVISLTAKVAAEDDAVLAMALTYAGATGVTLGASGNTEAGVAPVCQIETMEVTHGADGDGTAELTIASALLDGGSKAINVPLLSTDSTADAVAAKFRDALSNDTDISTHFAISGEGANVVLTAKVAAADDDTLDISVTDTGGTGVTFGSSADTQAGVAPVCQIETIEVTNGATVGAGTPVFQIAASVFPSGVEACAVPVTADDDTAAEVAAKIRAAFAADDDISEHFDISGENADVIITAKEAAANDPGLESSMVTADGTGITVGSSGNTQAGVEGTQQIETVEVTHEAT